MYSNLLFLLLFVTKQCTWSQVKMLKRCEIINADCLHCC